MIRFTTLGAVELRSTEGDVLRGLLAQPKKVALLAYLAAASRGIPRERDEIRVMFWPEDDEHRARHSLNQALHVIRGELRGRGVDSIGRTQVGIDTQVLWCDVAEFYRALERRDFEGASRYYHGTFLPGLFVDKLPEFDRWLDRKRARLAREAADVAWKLALVRESAGDAAGAVSFGRRLLELSPYDESAIQRVLQLLGRIGDHASAKHAFDTFASSVRADLDVEPSLSTIRLAESVLRRRAATTPTESRPIRAAFSDNIEGRDHAIISVDPPATSRRSRSYPRGVAAALAASAVIAFALFAPGRKQSTSRSAARFSAATALYEKGRYEWDKRTPAALTAALGYFSTALLIDSTFAAAHSGIADTYMMRAWYGLTPSPEELTAARTAAERAVAISPLSAESHASLGNVYAFADHNEGRARIEYSRAIELDSSYVAARDWYAFNLAASGKLIEALRQMMTARALAPRSPAVGTDLATMLFWSRKYQPALTEIKRVAELDSTYTPMHRLLWRVNAALGNRDAAFAALQLVMRDEEQSEQTLRAIQRAYVAGDWLAVLEQRLAVVERPVAHSRRRSVEAAMIASQLGRPDSVAHWLTQARDEGNVAIRFAWLDPALDAFRDDPRLREILKLN
jgi:DNA-binding SARP family transcriptional activator